MIVQTLKINFANFKDLIKYDNNCVTQVLSILPEESILRQACYLFFNQDKHIKIKNPNILFLVLLSPFEQIKDAINFINDSNIRKDTLYLIKCCNEDHSSFSKYSIHDNKERLVLTKNALLSAGLL
ncbi:MAG: hypothetical protein QW550_00180 [Saccharolobus sp.]